MFYVLLCVTFYVHSSIAIILMGKRELIAMLNVSSWCLVMVEQLFLAVPWGCLQFVIVVFPDHTHLLFLVFKVSQGSLYQSFFFKSRLLLLTKIVNKKIFKVFPFRCSSNQISAWD